jgi:hypothetical protein
MPFIAISILRRCSNKRTSTTSGTVERLLWRTLHAFPNSARAVTVTVMFAANPPTTMEARTKRAENDFISVTRGCEDERTREWQQHPFCFIAKSARPPHPIFGTSDAVIGSVPKHHTIRELVVSSNKQMKSVTEASNKPVTRFKYSLSWGKFFNGSTLPPIEL